MKKLYEIEYVIRTVVEAHNFDEAYSVANESFQDIVRDTGTDSLDVEVCNELVEGCELPCGWDADCYPYGRGWNEEELRIGEILERQECNT